MSTNLQSQTREGITVIQQAFNDLLKNGIKTNINLKSQYNVINAPAQDSSLDQHTLISRQFGDDNYVASSGGGNINKIVSIDGNNQLLAQDDPNGLLSNCVLDMGGEGINNMSDPQFAQSATTRNYTDINYLSYLNPNSNVDMLNTFTITNVPDPSSAQDVATKNYSDNKDFITNDYTTEENKIDVSSSTITRFKVNNQADVLTLANYNSQDATMESTGFSMQMRAGGNNSFQIQGNDTGNPFTNFNLNTLDQPGVDQLAIFNFGTTDGTTSSLFGSGRFTLPVVGQQKVAFIQGQLNGSGLVVYTSGQAWQDSTLTMMSDTYPAITQPQITFNRKTGYDGTVTVTEDQQFPNKLYTDTALALKRNQADSLSTISTTSPALSSISANSQKITSLANGTLSTDGINLGQLTSGLNLKRDYVDSLANISTTTPNGSDVDMNSQKLINLADGSSDNDAVNKFQLDEKAFIQYTISGSTSSNVICQNSVISMKPDNIGASNAELFITGVFDLVEPKIKLACTDGGFIVLQNNLTIQENIVQTGTCAILGCSKAPQGDASTEVANTEWVDDYFTKKTDTLVDINTRNPPIANLDYGATFKIKQTTAPTLGVDLCNKTYVDTQDALRVPYTGATGTVNLGAQKIQSSTAPSTGNDLTNKTYVDSVVGSGGTYIQSADLSSKVECINGVGGEVDVTGVLSCFNGINNNNNQILFLGDPTSLTHTNDDQGVNVKSLINYKNTGIWDDYTTPTTKLDMIAGNIVSTGPNGQNFDIDVSTTSTIIDNTANQSILLTSGSSLVQLNGALNQISLKANSRTLNLSDDGINALEMTCSDKIIMTGQTNSQMILATDVALLTNGGSSLAIYKTGTSPSGQAEMRGIAAALLGTGFTNRSIASSTITSDELMTYGGLTNYHPSEIWNVPSSSVNSKLIVASNNWKIQSSTGVNPLTITSTGSNTLLTQLNSAQFQILNNTSVFSVRNDSKIVLDNGSSQLTYQDNSGYAGLLSTQGVQLSGNAINKLTIDPVGANGIIMNVNSGGSIMSVLGSGYLDGGSGTPLKTINFQNNNYLTELNTALVSYGMYQTVYNNTRLGRNNLMKYCDAPLNILYIQNTEGVTTQYSLNTTTETNMALDTSSPNSGLSSYVWTDTTFANYISFPAAQTICVKINIPTTLITQLTNSTTSESVNGINGSALTSTSYRWWVQIELENNFANTGTGISSATDVQYNCYFNNGTQITAVGTAGNYKPSSVYQTYEGGNSASLRTQIVTFKSQTLSNLSTSLYMAIYYKPGTARAYSFSVLQSRIKVSQFVALNV